MKVAVFTLILSICGTLGLSQENHQSIKKDTCLNVDSIKMKIRQNDTAYFDSIQSNYNFVGVVFNLDTVFLSSNLLTLNSNLILRKKCLCHETTYGFIGNDTLTISITENKKRPVDREYLIKVKMNNYYVKFNSRCKISKVLNAEIIEEKTYLWD